MADQGHDDTERRTALKRFRMMREETTDPLAIRLMGDIISELETEAGTKSNPAANRRE
jgi:hypothetical protein